MVTICFLVCAYVVFLQTTTLQHEVENAPTQPDDGPLAQDATVDSKPNYTKEQPAQDQDATKDTHKQEDPSKQNATEPPHANTDPPKQDETKNTASEPEQNTTEPSHANTDPPKQDETKSTESAGSKDKEGQQPSKGATNDGQPTHPTPTPEASTKQEDHHQPDDKTAPPMSPKDPAAAAAASASASISFDEDDNYYTILGVSEHASQAEVKRAYKERSLMFHPDKNQGSGRAYDTLLDPVQRFKYNERNRLGLNHPSEVLPSAAAPGPNATRLQAEVAARMAARDLQSQRAKEKRATAKKVKELSKAAASPKAKGKAKAKAKPAPKASPKKKNTGKKKKHQDDDEEDAPEKGKKAKKEDPPVASLPTAHSRVRVAVVAVGGYCYHSA